jgi:prepilin-type N-terminal cleavage/methylation domain-containing protein
MRVNFISQRGFTLVEVLTVMLVLVAIASITVESTKDFVFQGRYDITKDRYEKIKKAIIGDPNQVINGQPNIEGFVKDMGRLPDNIRELIQAGYCVTTGGAAPADLTPEWQPTTCTGDWLWSNTACTDGTSTTEAACTGGHRWLGRTLDGTTGLYYGWNGAYLSSNQTPDNNEAFVDGWGNTSNNLNYGWNFTNPHNGTLTLFSSGKGSGTDIYDADYPTTQPAMTINDWGIALPINVNITIATVARKLGGIARPTTQADCEYNGGTWNTLSTPPCSMTIEYTEPLCTANRGNWDGSRCSIINPATSAACLNFGGSWNSSSSVCTSAWSYQTITPCLNLHFTGSLHNITSLPAIASSIITENGLFQTVSFTLGASGSVIPQGKAAFSINVYDATQTPSCTSTTYPAGRQPQIVTILPRSSLNFNW